jgi:hypothetical protein
VISEFGSDAENLEKESGRCPAKRDAAAQHLKLGKASTVRTINS